MKGHHLCPCGSGKKFRDCHAPLYWKLNQYYTQKNLLQDYLSILPLEARENYRLKSLESVLRISSAMFLLSNLYS